MVDATWDEERKRWLSARTRELGFSLAGIAPVGILAASSEAEDAARFEAWIDSGHAGEMDYLKRRDEGGQLLRSSVRVAHPWANSVIVCALSYAAPAPLSTDPAATTAGWIARYAWSGESRSVESQTGEFRPPNDPQPELRPADYHNFLLLRLQQLAHELAERAGGATRCYVDTGPLLERSLAARAGIGWIGKNTCVLNQTQGSWLLLGVILTSLRLPTELFELPAADRCGSCTRCIDACPTDALTAPHHMDASRCIAYLTIEKKGSVPADLRPLIGRQVFGCDICQDVCPWNRRAPAGNDSTISPRPELINPDLGWLAGLDPAAFKRWFKGSPLERTRRPRLHRNVAIAMGNSADSRFLPQLQTWKDGDDPVLAEAALWAITRIRANSAIEHDLDPEPAPAAHAV